MKANAGEAAVWTARHFSLANPRGAGQEDVATLLRRVADELERLGRIDVLDLTFHTEFTDDGPWPSVTIYYNERKSGQYASSDVEGG